MQKKGWRPSLAGSARPVPDATAVEFDDLFSARDACGVGFVASIDGKRNHDIIDKAIRGLSCTEHRGASQRGQRLGRRRRSHG